MTTERRLRVADFVLWVLGATTATVACLAVLSLAVTGGLLGLKLGLFLVGFALFGIAALALQPKSPRRDRKLVDFDGDDPTRFERLLYEVPPLRDEWLPAERRVSRNWKLFATSLALLAVSLALEDVFGVAVS